ncbi:MAG: hypothetical protein ACRDKE_10975, partial [Solirubrobacterales bacterium]
GNSPDERNQSPCLSGNAPCELETKVVASHDRGQYYLQEITFKTESSPVGTAIRNFAFRLVPKQITHPTVGIVAIQQTHPGAEQVVGELQDGVPIDPDMDYARELALQGYVTIAADIAGQADDIAWERRRAAGATCFKDPTRSSDACSDGNRAGSYYDGIYGPPSYAPCQGKPPSECLLNFFYKTALRKHIWDQQRAIDVLKGATPTLDSYDGSKITKIAVIGHSWGGIIAPFVSALDTRVDLAIASSGLQKYAESNETICNLNYLNVAPCSLPLTRRDLIALTAPRKLVINDNKDVEDDMKSARELVGGPGSWAKWIDPNFGAHEFLCHQRLEAYREISNLDGTGWTNEWSCKPDLCSTKAPGNEKLCAP